MEQVVATAPNFASAWGLLALTRATSLPPHRDMIGEPEHTAAQLAVDRAVALDPDCPDALSARLALLPAFGRYTEKMSITRRALNLSPSDALALWNRALMLSSVGYMRDALEVHRRMVEIDPLHSWPHSQYAAALYFVNRREEAMRAMEETTKRFPEVIGARVTHAIQLVHLALTDDSREREALSMAQGPRGPSNAPVNVEASAVFAFLEWSLSLKPKTVLEREDALKHALSVGPEGAMSISVCEFGGALGHQDLVFRSLFAALDTGRPISGGIGPRWLAARPFFIFPNSPLRHDPRFALFSARVGLVEFWMTSGQWPDCANEVSYDFKTECEKAAREVASA